MTYTVTHQTTQILPPAGPPKRSRRERHEAVRTATRTLPIMTSGEGVLRWVTPRGPAASDATFGCGRACTSACPVSARPDWGRALLYITHGPSAELGRGPPQAAWRGAVVHPSGGPSAPGRRCWRLGRKRPSPFFKLGAHSATLRPEFGGPESLRCCCAKGVGHRAQLMLRARRGDGENNHPVPLLRTPTPQSSLSPAPHTQGAVTTTESLESSCHVQNQDGDSDGAITGMVRGKWSGGGERQPAR